MPAHRVRTAASWLLEHIWSAYVYLALSIQLFLIKDHHKFNTDESSCATQWSENKKLHIPGQEPGIYPLTVRWYLFGQSVQVGTEPVQWLRVKPRDKVGNDFLPGDIDYYASVWFGDRFRCNETTEYYEPRGSLGGDDWKTPEGYTQVCSAGRQQARLKQSDHRDNHIGTADVGCYFVAIILATLVLFLHTRIEAYFRQALDDNTTLSALLFPVGIVWITYTFAAVHLAASMYWAQGYTLSHDMVPIRPGQAGMALVLSGAVCQTVAVVLYAIAHIMRRRLFPSPLIQERRALLQLEKSRSEAACSPA